jgi:guanine deaminase
MRSHGLLNERAVLAHGIWLDDRPTARCCTKPVRRSPSAVSSNLFLGSGLFGWQQATAAGVERQLWPATWAAAPACPCCARLADGYKVQAVWDWAVGPVAQHRDSRVRDLHERVFAWITLGDERNLAATFVRGVQRYARAATPAGPAP